VWRCCSSRSAATAWRRRRDASLRSLRRWRARSCRSGSRADSAAADLEALRTWRASPLFYLFWALLQQHLALGYFNARLRRALPPGRYARAGVALLSGLGFGALHLPALELGIAGGLLQGWLAWHWQRAENRNLFAFALVHAALASLYAECTTLPMRVGR
jgi:hypothetical protein